MIRKEWSKYLADKSEANLNALVYSYSDSVGYMAWALRGRRTWIDLEDVKSEGMIGVFVAIRDLDISKVKNVDAWVHLCAKRKINKFLVKAQHRAHALAGEFSGDIEPRLEDSPLVDTLSLLTKVSKEERLVMYLRHFLDWELKDIARVIGCSIPNVHYIEKRASARLQPQLI